MPMLREKPGNDPGSYQKRPADAAGSDRGGEIRDATAIDMLTAMNTGHDGSLSTGHANSPGDMLNRLETLVLMGMEIPLEAVRQQIASAIDIIVHLGRLRDKSRKVLEICEVGQCEGERSGCIRCSGFVRKRNGRERSWGV